MLLAAPAAASFLPQSPFSNDARGLTGAAFLKQPVGARATALAESCAAASGDAESFFWNPAGLASLKRPEVSASYDSLLETSYSSALSFGAPAGPGVAGATLLYHSQAAVEAFTEVGDPAGSFTPSDLAASVGWARSNGADSFGAAFKLIQQKLAGRSATGWAVDLGWQVKDGSTLGEAPVDFGFAVRNLGSPIALGPTADPLPLLIDAGLQWRSTPLASTFLDAHLPVDHAPYASIGQEFRRSAQDATFALRFGYSMARRSDLGGLAGFSAGVGMLLGSLRLDYAWVPLGDLGTTHRVSLGFRFGDVFPAATPPRSAPVVARRCYVLAAVVPQFAKAREFDVFSRDPLCFDPSGVADIDSYLDKANTVSGDVRLATTLVGLIDKGQKTLSNGMTTRNAAKILNDLTRQAVENGNSLVKENSQVVARARNNMNAGDPVRWAKVVQGISETGSRLEASVSEGSKGLETIQDYLGIGQ